MELPSADQGYHGPPPFSVEAGELGGAGTGSVNIVLDEESSTDGVTISLDDSG